MGQHAASEVEATPGPEQVVHVPSTGDQFRGGQHCDDPDAVCPSPAHMTQVPAVDGSGSGEKNVRLQHWLAFAAEVPTPAQATQCPATQRSPR